MIRARRAIMSLYLVSAVAGAPRAQSFDPWYRFEVRNTERYGYKDGRGTVRVQPQLVHVIADTFHHIIAVEDPAYRGYYLLKDGRRIGADSMFYFDNTPDCESEGLIRFQDRAADRVGFLDGAGNIAIPAVYNAVSRFHNGLAVAYRNGRRQCADLDSANCEHWTWVDGEQVLINRDNEILVNGWNLDDRTFNWYSIEIDPPTTDTSPAVTILGANGHTYRFTDYRAEFWQWFQKDFLPAVRAGSPRATELLHSKLVIWDGKRWNTLTAPAFARRFPVASLRARLGAGLLDSSAIFDDELNPFVYDAPEFRPYYNSCGAPFKERYPGFSVVITRKPTRPEADPDATVQDHFSFLRTAAGYRLIGISFPD
jgi:hypothetical protein